MQKRNEEVYTALLQAMEEYTMLNGIAPSLQELSETVGISKATASRYLRTMRERGIVSGKGGHRDMLPANTEERRSFVRVPVLGEVACGLPKLAEENIEEYVSLPVTLFGSGDYYILRASGDSMIEVGVYDGDMVLIRQQSTADPGQIVVALVGDEATLKRFFPEKDRVRLHPENSSMEDIYVDSCVVQGVAVKVIRDLS